jgi:plastin-1
VDFKGFIQICINLQTHVDTKLSGSKNKYASIKTATTTLLHTIGESEKVEFFSHLNSYLRDDPVVKRYLPINPMTNDLFDIVKNGILLCKLINVVVPGTIDD